MRRRRIPAPDRVGSKHAWTLSDWFDQLEHEHVFFYNYLTKIDQENLFQIK